MIDLVVIHYRLPIRRLNDFFSWNDRLFRANKVRVVVVSEQEKIVPDYARVVLYPFPLKTFSIARTANFGIRQARELQVETGTESAPICKTDVDCIFTPEAIGWVKTVKPGFGVCFKYCMIPSPSARPGDFLQTIWQSSRGTLSLHFSDWDKISGYNENMIGYGIDDGDAVSRAKRAARVEIPLIPFWHVAHHGGEQRNQHKRGDQWNRENGFCPKNHKHNQSVMGQKWSRPDWGTVEGLRKYKD